MFRLFLFTHLYAKLRFRMLDSSTFTGTKATIDKLKTFSIFSPFSSVKSPYLIWVGVLSVPHVTYYLLLSPFLMNSHSPFLIPFRFSTFPPCTINISFGRSEDYRYAFPKPVNYLDYKSAPFCSVISPQIGTLSERIWYVSHFNSNIIFCNIKCHSAKFPTNEVRRSLDIESQKPLA